MTVLLILLATTVAVAVVLGVLAKMPPLQIAAQSAAMCAATLVFFTLVKLL